MIPSDLLGLVANVLGVFGAGYGIGYGTAVWRAGRRQKAAEDELIAKRLKQFLGAVQIKTVDCESPNLIAGQTVPISFVIKNEGGTTLEVWLGASVVSQSGREHYDLSQDKPTIIEPGTKTYQRYLTVPADADAGEYHLYGAVWLGKLADPDNSIRLARTKRKTTLNIRKK
jgi:hypothetical protein